MDIQLQSHGREYHPELPSFRDKYIGVDAALVRASYSKLFLPDKKRYITGGIATQFHCYPNQIRGSDDIDLNDLRRVNWTEFAEQALQDFQINGKISAFPGYQVILLRRNHNFVVHVCNWYLTEENKFYLNIEFPDYSIGYHKKMLPIFEREFDQAMDYNVDGTFVRVLNPTDIIARKLVRLLNFYMHEKIPVFSAPSELYDHMETIWDQRGVLYNTKACAQKGCQECSTDFHSQRTKLRSMTDTYDIRLLLAFMDQRYFDDVMKSYEVIGRSRGEIEAILESLRSI